MDIEENIMDFEKKTIIITGAGSGIGKAASLMIAGEGAFVAACDINREKVDETVEAIKKGFGEVSLGFAFDVSDSMKVRDMVNSVLNKYGRIDVLVNCAGIISLGKTESITDEMLENVLGVNFKGTFYCCREIIPVMKSQKSGCIVNISSGAIKTGGFGVAGDYVAAKGAVASLTLNLARQLAPWRIRVNSICPGPIDTPMIHGKNYTEDIQKNVENSTPLGIGFPEDVAHAILFLASNIRARYITGEILDVNGGLTMD